MDAYSLPRPAYPLGLQFRRTFARLNVFACGGAVHVRFHRTDTDIACLFVFTHEPFMLLLGDHLAAVWTSPDPSVGPPNRRSMLPAHW